MSWYYALGTQQTGPVAEQELQRLLQAGELTIDSLVWTTGMAEWKPYREVFTAGASSAPGPAPLATPAEGGGLAGVVCAECGKSFRPDEVINFSGRFVCAGCKPLYLQRLREGVAVPGALVYATFGQRFAAKFIDFLLMFALNTLIQLTLGASIFNGVAKGGGSPALLIGFQLTLFVISTMLNIGYSIFFVGRFGATPGKMALKLRVVTPDGGRVTYGRATGRAFAEILSGLILYIGYLMAAWDGEKRALHDRICDTRVIKL